MSVYRHTPWLDIPEINFPKLASRASINDQNSNMKDGQAYRTWKPLATLELQRLNLLYIVEQDPPTDLTTYEGERWVQGNANIFKALTDMLHNDEMHRILSSWPQKRSLSKSLIIALWPHSCNFLTCSLGSSQLHFIVNNFSDFSNNQFKRCRILKTQ